jgi:hypothetical protein
MATENIGLAQLLTVVGAKQQTRLAVADELNQQLRHSLGQMVTMTDKELESHSFTFRINANETSYHHAVCLIVCLLISPTQRFELSSCAANRSAQPGRQQVKCEH